MLITVDLSVPDNDIEMVGLAEGETIEARLGPRGYIAWRLLMAAARVLFLALQKVDKPDIAAATGARLDQEARFIRERLQELAPSGGARNGGGPGGGRHSGPRGGRASGGPGRRPPRR